MIKIATKLVKGRACYLLDIIKLLLIVLIFLPFPNYLLGEGTKQLQPTSQSYGRMQIMPDISPFASFNATPEHRLNISVCNQGEKIYYGFGYIKSSDGTIQYDVIYRIKDPNGNIVVGPAPVPTSGAGYISNYSQAFNGPNTISPSGYNPLSYTPTMLGDYYIEFDFTQPYNYERRVFDFVDITVVSAGNQAVNGRLWSKDWLLTTDPQSGFSSPFMAGFDGIMYIYSDDGVVTSANLNNMQPFVFNISANQSGCFNTGNFAQDRKSVDGNNTYPQYKIFLNDPDSVCFPSGHFGSISAPTTITGCPGQFCINITVDKPGNVEVLLNLNGIPGYQANSSDLTFSMNVTPGLNCIPWSGLDGLGNIIPSGTTIPVEVNYFNGLTNLPLYDVEGNPNGFIVQIVRPYNPTPGYYLRLFWDDSNISGGSINLAGCVNITGCHPWSVGNCYDQPLPSYCSLGDMSTINTWWYANSITDTSYINFEYPVADANIYAPPGMNDTLICAYSNSIQLNGGVQYASSGVWSGGTGQFQPSNSVLNPVYTFSQTDKDNGFVTLIINTVGGSCATVADTLKITLIVPDVVVSNDKTICQSDAFQLSASGMLSYEWSPPTGLSATNISNPIASPQTSTVYSVLATDVHGCTATGDVVITVQEKPDISFNADILSGCKPLNVNFTPFSSDQIASYEWNFGDAASGFGNSSLLEDPSHTYNSSGTFSVSLTVISAAGCSNSIIYNNLITVYPQPVASFYNLPHEGDSENMLFSFFDESVGAVVWHWNFGDENSGTDNYSDIQNPQHQYNATNFYDVWLYVSSEFGCTDSTSSEIIIRGDFALYVPNAFTPDDDGLNDYFMPKGVEFNNNAFVMYIYNRWGQLVFMTDDINNPWNGKMMNTGNPQPQDVYVWVMWQENYLIGRQKYTGNVTLIR